MRLDEEGESSNVEDRRGFRVSPGMAGGGIGTLVIVLIGLYLGIDPSALLQQTGVDTSAPPPQEQAGAPDEMRTFVSRVLASTERTWGEIFEQNGRRYEAPKLVLFTGGVDSACGFAQTAAGPFYCPEDRKVYIDLDFYRELRDRFQAPGDFAQAYVIAHEVGHHAQDVLGISARVQRAMQQDPAGRNALSVRLELQADCLAGVWGHSAARRQLLDPGDTEEGLRAAAAVGDDRLQQAAGRRVSPESFTHGSSAERVRWFRTGLTSGSVDSCDTFAR